MNKMGYSGKGLGTHEKGIIHPIDVKQSPWKLCLEYGEINKISKALNKENLDGKNPNYDDESIAESSRKKK